MNLINYFFLFFFFLFLLFFLKRKTKTLHALLLLVAISGCGTYSNKWKCHDAKGLFCEMLSSVDEKIDSGEIEEVYSNCRGKNCSKGGIVPFTKKIYAKEFEVENTDKVVIEK